MPRQWTYLKNVFYRSPPSVPTWKDTLNYFVAKTLKDPFPTLVALMIICNVVYMLSPFISKWWHRMLCFLYSRSYEPEDIKENSIRKKPRRNSIFKSRRKNLEENSLFNGSVRYTVIDPEDIDAPQMLDWDEEISKWNAAALSPGSRAILDAQHWENVQRKNAVCKLGKQRWQIKHSTSELGLPLQEASLEGIFQNYTPGIVVGRDSSEMVYPSRSMGSLTNGPSYTYDNYPVLTDFSSCLKELIEYRESLSQKSSRITIDKKVQCENAPESPQMTPPQRKKAGRPAMRQTSLNSRSKSVVDEGKHLRQSQDLNKMSSHSLSWKEGAFNFKYFSKPSTNTPVTPKNRTNAVQAKGQTKTSSGQGSRCTLNLFEKMKQTGSLLTNKSNNASRQSAKRLTSREKPKNTQAEGKKIEKKKSTKNIPETSEKKYTIKQEENELNESTVQEENTLPVQDEHCSNEKDAKERGNGLIILKLESDESMNMVANILSNHSLHPIISRELGLHDLNKSLESVMVGLQIEKDNISSKPDIISNIQDSKKSVSNISVKSKKSVSNNSVKSKNSAAIISNNEVDNKSESNRQESEIKSTTDEMEKLEKSEESAPKGGENIKKTPKNAQRSSKNVLSTSTTTASQPKTNRPKSLGSMSPGPKKAKVEMPKSRGAFLTSGPSQPTSSNKRATLRNTQNVSSRGQKVVGQDSTSSEAALKRFQLVRKKAKTKSAVNKPISSKSSSCQMKLFIPNGIRRRRLSSSHSSSLRINQSVIQPPAVNETPISITNEQTERIESMLQNDAVGIDSLNLNGSKRSLSKEEDTIKPTKEVESKEQIDRGEDKNNSQLVASLESMEEKKESSDKLEVLNASSGNQEMACASDACKRSTPSSRSTKPSLNQLIGVCHQKNKLKLKKLEKMPCKKDSGFLQSSKPRSLFTKEMSCSLKSLLNTKLNAKKALHPQIRESSRTSKTNKPIPKVKKRPAFDKNMTPRSSNKSAKVSSTNLKNSRTEMAGSSIPSIDPMKILNRGSVHELREKQVVTELRRVNSATLGYVSDLKIARPQRSPACEEEDSSRKLPSAPSPSIDDVSAQLNTNVASDEGKVNSEEDLDGAEIQSDRPSDHNLSSLQTENDSFNVIVHGSSSESLQERTPKSDGDIQLSLTPKNEVHDNKLKEIECYVKKELLQEVNVTPTVIGDVD